MIYTITLNPSLDYVLYLNTLLQGNINRSKKEEIYPGGKGINVSIVLKNLNITSEALGFIGGFTGREIDSMLNKLNINTNFTQIEHGLSRINVKVEASDETEINSNGPEITSTDLNNFYNKLDKIQDGDFLVLAGSIPSSLPNTIYEDIISKLSHKKIYAIVDTTKKSLLNTLKHKPFLIKPNHIELAELFNVTITTDEEIICYAQRLQLMGAQNVLVSKGGDGSVLLTNTGEIIKMAAPLGNVINTVGSGDSMIAGFIAGYIQSNNLYKALKYATAVGSATAFSPWLAEKAMIDTVFLNL